MLKSARNFPEAECHVIGGEFGDGSYARMLRGLAQREGVADRVHFRGYSAEAAAEMARCAVLAIPSKVEAFGMVAIEAMAAGKPVVATRHRRFAGISSSTARRVFSLTKATRMT